MMNLIEGECLAEMAKIPDNYIDMVMCDLPYGTTQCKWDSVIPFDALWREYKRICKPTAAIVLTAAQPFTSALVMSNIKDFKYQWVWDKVVGRGHLVAKKRPMANHEDVCVFYRSAPTYNPQMVQKVKPERGKAMEHSRTAIVGGSTTGAQGDVIRTHSYPKTIQVFPSESNRDKLHPTQKPVALMEYMIKTYTNEGMTVLDNCMGSGTTGVAAVNLGRAFVGIERDPAYFKIASERIAAAQKARI
jgi:site-specific DNA-methyltransferase (adenine-specific)